MLQRARLSRLLVLLIAAVLGGLVALFVDMKPKVEGDFFFSSDDPQVQESKRVERLFGSEPHVYIAVQASGIFSAGTLSSIRELSEELAKIDGVGKIYSLTHGPKSPGDARESPFWSHLLLSEDRKSSIIVAALKPVKGEDNESDVHGESVRRIDRVLAAHGREGFGLSASGVPYVAEHIRAQLSRDLIVFSLAALATFTVVLLLLFRQWVAVLGMIIAALAACFMTFLVRALLGMSTGILTPNLWTIAFVLTLSQAVYLTTSYRRQSAGNDPEEALKQAVRVTGPASILSLLANLLGFSSLMLVEAKPLREFGISGAIAAACAILVTYTLYPPFLSALKPGHVSGGSLVRFGDRFFSRPHVPLAVGFAIVALALAPFSRKTDTDPSLPSYLGRGSAVRTGLEAMDLSGGSSPLDLVVRDAHRGGLADEESFKRLKALQNALEKHPDVGNVVSVALLMEETKRPWYAFLFSWKKRIKVLDEPEHGSVGKSFISGNRTLGRFILRMHEAERTRPREEILADLEGLVRKHGFEPEITSGAYQLQGEMSELVRGSVLKGLAGLIGIFFAITLFASRSLRAALAMTFCLGLVPLALYGFVGLIGMRLDIISAPAANVALPLGIDEMIHMSYAARRARKEGGDSREAWHKAVRELWLPTFASMLVVAAGFSLFLFSNFPPTQRLGVLVTAGAALTDLAVLILLPPMVTLGRRKRGGDAVRNAA